MEHTLPYLKYAFIFVLVVGWIYYRRLRSRKKKGHLHGRELWGEGFRHRHQERLQGAESWEERRRVKKTIAPPRKIKNELLDASRQSPTAERESEETRE